MSEIPEDVMQAAEAVAYEYEDGDRLTGRLTSLIARAILAERERSQWQPIETAPRDGTDILCVCMKTKEGSEENLGHMEVDNWKDRYHGFGRFNHHAWPATHWMPLPSPPSKEGE